MSAWQDEQAAYNLNSDYSKLGGFQSAYDQLAKQQMGMGSSDRAGVVSRLNSVGDQFKTLWTNLVGRAPTDDELNAFMSTHAGNIVANSPNGRSETVPTDVRNQITSYVSDAGQQAAKDYATQQLTAQQGQANDLANLFRTNGRQAISDTEQSLMDYQSKLFDKLRPNLITSLQAQGLLNTGGLNEALAGKAADLANQTTGYLADARLQNENTANQIQFAGASAPLAYQQNQIQNQVPFLQGQGQTALNDNYNTFLTNLNYQNQLGLIGAQTQAQASLQPSFLRTMGQSFGTSMGNSMGQWFGPGAGQSNAGGTSGYGGVAKLFAA